MRTRTSLLVVLTVTIVLSSVAAAMPIAASAQGHGPPQQTTKTIYLNLTGTASLSRNQSAGPFQVTVNVTGPVTTRGNNGNGNGAGFSGNGLLTHVTITYQDSNGTVHTAQDFNTTASIHATESPYLGQGLTGFRFNLETHGRAGPILHVGLHGNTTGFSNDTYTAVSGGNAVVKTSSGADNYLLALMGTSELR